MCCLKKTVFAILAIGSSTAVSGAMGPICAPGNVTVPCEKSTWDAGVYALYLKPSYSGHPRAFNYRGNTVIDGQTVHHNTNNDFEWGFKLENSYHFSTGNDINVNWYHWNDATRENLHYTTEVTGFERYITPQQVDRKWDTVNFEFGQHANFGEFKNIRFHGGIQYAYLKYNTIESYVDNFPQSAFVNANGAIVIVPAGTNVGTNRIAYEFIGAGPRVGADMSYDWTKSFTIYANGAAALLVGNSKTNDTSTIEPNRASYTAVVPDLEAKLGLKYTYAMTQGNLILDGGYMVTHYWNVFHMVQANFDGTSNFAVHGPYLGLKYLGLI